MNLRRVFLWWMDVDGSRVPETNQGLDPPGPGLGGALAAESGEEDMGKLKVGSSCPQ